MDSSPRSRWDPAQFSTNHGHLDEELIVLTVYDFTTFVSDHPGGVDALENCGGIDGTEAYEYAGHSHDNMVKMQEYAIGKLEGNTEEQPLNPHNAHLTKKQPFTESSAGRFNVLIIPFLSVKVAIALMVCCTMVLGYHYIWTAWESSQLALVTGTDNLVMYTFGAGVGVASLLNLLLFRYFYKLLLSSLDYQNDVFSLPPTIPNRKRR